MSLPAADNDYVQQLFTAAEMFFHLPVEEKLASRLPQECGYRPGGIEYSQSADRPDQVESFTVRPRSVLMLPNFRRPVRWLCTSG